MTSTLIFFFCVLLLRARLAASRTDRILSKYPKNGLLSHTLSLTRCLYRLELLHATADGFPMPGTAVSLQTLYTLSTYLPWYARAVLEPNTTTKKTRAIQLKKRLANLFAEEVRRFRASYAIPIGLILAYKPAYDFQLEYQLQLKLKLRKMECLRHKHKRNQRN